MKKAVKVILQPADEISKQQEQAQASTRTQTSHKFFRFNISLIKFYDICSHRADHK